MYIKMANFAAAQEIYDQLQQQIKENEKLREELKLERMKNELKLERMKTLNSNNKRPLSNDTSKPRLSPLIFERKKKPVSPLVTTFFRNGQMSPIPIFEDSLPPPEPLTKKLSFEKKDTDQMEKKPLLEDNQVIIYIAAFAFHEKENYKKLKPILLQKWKRDAIEGRKFFRTDKDGSINILDYFQKMIEMNTLRFKNGESIDPNYEFTRGYSNRYTFLDVDIQHMYKVGSIYKNDSKQGTDQRQESYGLKGNPTKNLVSNEYYMPYYWIIDFDPIDSITLDKRTFCCNIIENGIHEKLFEHGYMANNYDNTNTRLRKSEAVFNLHACDLKNYINNLLGYFQEKKIVLSNKTEGGGMSNQQLKITDYRLVTNCKGCDTDYDDEIKSLTENYSNMKKIMNDDDIVLKF